MAVTALLAVMLTAGTSFATSYAGGSGPGYINGNEYAETIYGTNGAETIRGFGGGDYLAGLGGNDTIYGGQGDDLLRGDAGNDDIRGGAGSDRILGGAGNDTVYSAGNTKNFLGKPHPPPRIGRRHRCVEFFEEPQEAPRLLLGEPKTTVLPRFPRDLCHSRSLRRNVGVF